MYQPLAIDLGSSWDYSDLPSTSTPHLLDQFFATLVSSRFAVPPAALGNRSADAVGLVADAIKFQHGVIRAQILNLSALPVPFSPSANHTLNRFSPVTFTATARTSTRHLVQSPSSTRLLQALLTLTSPSRSSRFLPTHTHHTIPAPATAPSPWPPSPPSCPTATSSSCSDATRNGRVVARR